MRRAASSLLGLSNGLGTVLPPVRTFALVAAIGGRTVSFPPAARVLGDVNVLRLLVIAGLSGKREGVVHLRPHRALSTEH